MLGARNEFWFSAFFYCGDPIVFFANSLLFRFQLMGKGVRVYVMCVSVRDV